jgi:hypothetical protein
MANVDIQLGYKDSTWFTNNATLVLKVGQTVHLEQTGTYKIGDGTTQLSALLFLGSTGAATYTSTLKHIVKAGLSINKGQAVYVSSADGTNMIVSKASNVSEATSSKTMGLLETTLSTNGQGYVITEGLLAGLNTNSANVGDPVWLGVDGDLIYGLANKPYAPAHLVFVGIVTRKNTNNGEIFVKPQNGFELKEIHDIDLISNTPKNNDVLVYNSTSSLWENKQSNYLQIVSKDITDSTALTGTTAITLMKSILIPANTYATGDVVKILNRAVRNTATGTANNYYYINTTNSLTGATLIGGQSSASIFFAMERSLYIKSATNSETLLAASSSSGSEAITSALGASNLNINWAVNQYIIAAFQNAAVGNSTVMSSLIIQKY